MTTWPNIWPGRSAASSPGEETPVSSRTSQISTRIGNHSDEHAEPGEGADRERRAADAALDRRPTARPIRRTRSPAARPRTAGSTQPLSSKSVTSWSRIAWSSAATTPRRDRPRRRARSRPQSGPAPGDSGPVGSVPSAPVGASIPSMVPRPGLTGGGGGFGLVDQLVGRSAQAVAHQHRDPATVPHRMHAASTRYTMPTPMRSHARTLLGEHGAEHELRDEQAEQGERLAHADAAVRQHRHRERRLRGREEQLLALERVERQAARRATEDHEHDRQRADEQRPLVHLRRHERAQAAVGVEAPREQARNQQLGRFRRERREPLHEQERADAELLAGRRPATRRTAPRTTGSPTAE